MITERKKIGTIIPFYSRLGQFQEGKHTLVVGLDIEALRAHKKYRVFLGKNREYYYEAETKELLNYGYHKNSYWQNPYGKTVMILPVFRFQRKRYKQDKRVMKEKIMTERERFYRQRLVI